MSAAAPSLPAPDPVAGPVRHLYVHVPFCPSICPYCDFHVLERRAGMVERYLARIEEEAAWLARTYPTDLETVYLGGGTPSFLRGAEMEALVGSVRRHLGWGRLENTLEINPGTVSAARAAHWRALGFGRASVGVQSLDDATLRFLGRQHTAAQAREAVQTLTSQGFRVSGDLITAVPGQPLDSDIQGLVELGVGHVSAYTLTVEPGTEFARRGVTVQEDDERAGFERTEALLEARGFARYEISNYALPGQESRHNRAYWQGRTYLGLGPGAAGHYPHQVDRHGAEVGGHRRAAPAGEDGEIGREFPDQESSPVLTTRRTNPHLHEWLTGAQGESDGIDPQEYVTDALFMGLRLREGLDLADLARRSGLDVRERYGRPLARNVARGLLALDGDRLRATPEGWWVLNRVVTDFLEA